MDNRNGSEKKGSGDFLVGFFLTLAVIGAVAAALLLVLNLP